MPESMAQAQTLDAQGPLTDADLLALLPTMGKSQFWKRKARGDFRFLELSPQLPNSHTLYSRRLVTRWFDGVDLRAGQPRHHFGKALGRSSAQPPAYAVQPATPRRAQPTGEARKFAVGSER